MWLTSVSIRRPIFMIMFVLALVIMGWQSRSKMPVELEPKVDFPFVTVVTAYPGAGPNEIETLISKPLEKAVSSIGNLKDVTSSSQDGVSVIGIEFELGTDINAAAADVRDKVSATKASLPKDIDEPQIVKADIASEPIMTIALAGPLSPKEMRVLANEVIQDRLSKVGGVAGVNISGGEEREISVAIDKDRLQAYGVGINEVVDTINGANLNVPAGTIKENTRDYSVRTVGEFKNADEISNVRMTISGKNGKPDKTIKLSDIAKISDTITEPDTYSRINGKSSVILTIQKQSDANVVDAAEGVKKQLEELKSVLPAGVKTIITEDNSTFVEDSLRDVNKSLLEGILLVVLIVFLFLHSARATFIVAIAIPTSIVATYLPIHGMGFTINQMTMLALSLVVGILVDDSIVVLENIERHLRKRENPVEAAINGRSEIGLAAVTITFVDIVVFVPVAFMGGIVGQFFRQFGLTIAVATAFSLLMSFTLTPMLASRWMKSEDEKDKDEAEYEEKLRSGSHSVFDSVAAFTRKLFGYSDKFLSGLDRKYRGLLEWALHNRYMTIIIGVVTLIAVVIMTIPIPKGVVGPAFVKAMMPRIIVALVALILSAIALFNAGSRKVAIVFGLLMAFISLTIFLPFGFSFFPNTDRGQFAITIRTAPGTSLEATDAVVRQVEDVLKKVPEVKKKFYITTVGSSSRGMFGSGDSGPQYANIAVTAVDKTERKRSIEDIADWVNRQTSHIAGAEMINVSVGSGGGPGNAISMEVQGQNMSEITSTANKAAGVISKVPGAINVDSSWKAGKPERQIVVDRVRAAQMGMTVSQVAMNVRTAVNGDNNAVLREEGTEYPIMVRLDRLDRNKASDVENLIVGNKDGTPIYLRDVADVKYAFAPTKIDRKNRQRVVYVSADIAKGSEMGNVQTAIEGALKKMAMPAGITITTGGSGQMMTESFGYMFSAMALAIVLVYMLMGALFESFLTPLVIMFSLPQAMIGALLALLVTGNSMSIVAMIGIIMLVGLVTKNAILLVDYTNTMRARGLDRHEALLQAGPTRLRPILMTTLAMVGGMLPTALAHTQGSEIRAPMAVTVIGGLILSTMLTLIVIPVMYTIVDDWWHAFLKAFFPGAYERSIKKQIFSLEENVKEPDVEVV